MRLPRTEGLSERHGRRSPAALLFALLIAVTFLTVACSQAVPGLDERLTEGERPTGGASPADSFQPLAPATQAEQTLQRLLATEKPDRDLFDLGRRYKGIAQDVDRIANAERPDYAVGTVQSFWVADNENSTYYQIKAELRGKSEHLYMYVEEGLDIPQSGIDKTIRVFEETIYPTVRKYFGEEWSPGVDNDPRITVLNARIPGVGGYYSSADEFPNEVNPFSNEREMFYINVDGREYGPGTEFYLSTLCHEFQHMVHWNKNASQETWLNEGASMVASVLCGYSLGGIASWYAADPDVQLTHWSDDPDPRHVLPHYAAAYLFMEYFAQHYGGYEKIQTLIASPLRGQGTVDAYMEAEGYAVDFNDVFADWTAANFIDDERPADGAYYYDVRLPRMRPQEIVRRRDLDKNLTVKQFGAKYVDLRMPQGSYTVDFRGTPQVRIFPTTAPSGTHVWWGNRSDMAATSLTRAVDLREAVTAVFRFKTWYDIEDRFDYAYVAVSADDGKTWQTLPGTSTTTDNPNGNNLGHGFTGKSGGGDVALWIDEEINLDDYAGKRILLRFEYVTDDAVNGVGFLVDDFSISGIEYSDDAESDGDWDARGFFRTDGVLPQYFIVQLVRYVDGLPSVERVILRGQDSMEVTFQLDGYGQKLQHAVLIVSGATPVTTEVAHFNVQIVPVADE